MKYALPTTKDTMDNMRFEAGRKIAVAALEAAKDAVLPSIQRGEYGDEDDLQDAFNLALDSRDPAALDLWAHLQGMHDTQDIPRLFDGVIAFVEVEGMPGLWRLLALAERCTARSDQRPLRLVS